MVGWFVVVLVGDSLVCCLMLSFGGSGSGLDFVLALVVVVCGWFLSGCFGLVILWLIVLY